MNDIVDSKETEEITQAIEKHGPAFEAYYEYLTDESAIESFEEAFAGEWSTEKAFAENMFDNCFEVPDNIVNYINYEQFAYDLFMCDYFSIENPSGGIFVFRNL